MLAGQERLGGMKFATAVPTKGASGKFTTDKCLDFIEDCGDSNGRIIIKNDQEPSMQFVIKDLVEAREEGRSILEESPVKSSGSNGIVERSIQGIEGHIRVIFLALRERLSGNLESRDRIVMFIPEYAAYLLNCLEVWQNGKTAYERTKGKKPTVLGVQFGSKNLHKIHQKRR